MYVLSQLKESSLNVLNMFSSATPYLFLYVVAGRLRDLISSGLEHRWLPGEFESRRVHIWKVFNILLRSITFGGRLAHLAYLVH